MIEKFQDYLANKPISKPAMSLISVKGVWNIISTDQKQRFLKELSRNHKDWQVRQADHALRLYDFSLSQGQRDERESSSGRIDEWRKLEEETHKVLGFRRRSLDTKKTCLALPFQGFVKEK